MSATTVYKGGVPAYVASNGVKTPVTVDPNVPAAPSVGAAAGPATVPVNNPVPQPGVTSSSAAGVTGAGAATPSTAYKNLDIGSGDPYATALTGAISSVAPSAFTTPNENNIYNQKLSQYQSEIDATNSIYVDMLAKAKQQGLSDLGSGRAIEARSGTLGSDFASAQNSKIAASTASSEQDIENEQQQKVAAILGQARSDANTDYNAKIAAQKSSLSDYITYLGAQSTRNDANVQKVAGSILSQGLTPDQIDPAQLKTIADSYGVQPGDIISSYNTQKKTQDDAAAKTASDEAFNLSPGETRYDAAGNPIASVVATPKTIGTPATGIYTENADGSYTQTMAPVGGDSVQSLAQELVTGNLAPSDLSKRSTGVGSYSDILTAANTISQQLYGKPFDIAKANTDYKFATNVQTQNTLNYLGSLVGSSDGSTPSNLDQLITTSKEVAKPGFLGIGETSFPALNNAEQWSKLASGDPTVAAYYATLTEVSDQIAKILQGGGTGGTSDAKLAQAQSLFDKGFTPEQISAVAGALKPLLQNRATSMVKDNPYLSTYATQFGITQNNGKASDAAATTANSNAGFGWNGTSS